MVTSRKLPGTDVEVEIAEERYPGEFEEVRRVLRQFQADGDVLQARRAELTASAPEKWYAVSYGELYSADELPELISILRDAGIDPAVTPARYFSSRRRLHEHLV